MKRICLTCKEDETEYYDKITQILMKYPHSQFVNPGGREFEFSFGRCHVQDYCYKEDYETLRSFLLKNNKELP